LEASLVCPQQKGTSSVPKVSDKPRLTPWSTIHLAGLSPYMANLCPFYLGVADGDLRLLRSILHNAGGPCKRFLKQSGYRVAATVKIGFKRGSE
jgi:hypothetical protein